MNRHGSMNRVYRLIWSRLQNAWIPVAELARGRGKSSLRKLTVAALSLASTAALAGPEGGQVTAGAGTISQTGTTTTINQSSQNLSLNWQSFNIAPQETVNFVQPGASAIAVNRILDTNGSQILGHLNANGQVYLINPNGILFGQGAQVNVGGLVASTLDLNDASLTGDKRLFSGNGAGSVINRGAINAVDGGYVALLANHVGNEGTITAPNGAVALGAGSASTLTFSNNNLVSMQVDASVLNSQADNGGLIRADGGIVVMTAGAKDSLLASVVNNTGVIEARAVENRDGSIVLLGGMQAGTVNVAGTLDASAPNGGNGGFIETSAAHVQIADDAKITTAASMGLAGTWLIDPVDFTIAASGGDMTGATLSSNLGSGNVVIQSTTGSSGTLGDVNVNDVVTWSANKLTLNAQNNININANLNASSTASLAFEFGQGAIAANNTSNIVTNGASVNLPASTTNFTTKQGSNGAVKNYTVITSLGAAGSTTTTDLQGIAGNLAGNYVLGSNIDAATTSAWNAGAGFAPIGTDPLRFTGTFDGLGHTVSGLYINRTGSNFIGLFGYTAAGSMVRNVGLLGGSVASNSWATGALVGSLAGTLKNSYAAVSVTGFQTVGGLVGVIDGGLIIDSHASGDVIAYGGSGEAGGLVGLSWGSGGGNVIRSYATGNVSSSIGNVGGLMGINWGHITDSYATGTATGGTDLVGGLVGNNSQGTTTNSYATGAVSGRDFVGGLVGSNGNSVSNSHASGAVTGRNSVGGLAGRNYGVADSNYATGVVTGDTRVGGLIGHSGEYGSVDNSHATGAVIGSGDYVGGLIGSTYGSTVSNSYATGVITGRDFVGGLIGINSGGSGYSSGYGSYGGTITNSYANGAVQGRSYVGGLIGHNTSTGTITGGHAIGSVTASRGDAGGLVGRNQGALSNVYATGAVQGGEHHVGGLVGYNSAPINTSYASGAVTGVNGSSYIGGLVGRNYGSVSDSYATGDAQGFNYVGGLLGGNYGSVSTTYATGLVHSDNNAGGLIGSNYGSVVNSFWDKDTSGQTSSYGGTGLTSNQIMQLSSFSSWNLATPNTIAGTGNSGASWRIYEGYTGPLLTQFLTTLTIADATVVTYNGTAHNGMSVVPNGVLGTTATNAGVHRFYSNQQGYDLTGGTLTINKANLTITTSSVSKTYDGTLAASGAATVISGTLYTNIANSNTLDSISGGTFAFTNANAGTGNKSVTTSGVTISDGNSGNNYNVTYANNTTSTINKANVTLSTSDVTKSYDGTLTASGAAIVSSGALFTSASNSNTLDSISGGTFAFTNANAGAGNKTVSTSAVTVNDGNSGGNYNVSYANNTTSSINKANVTLSTSDVTKSYDGTLTASGAAIVSSGTLFTNASNSNTLDSLSGGTFAFTNANAGSGNKIVSTSAVTVNDGNSGNNYNVTYANNTTSTIHKANLILSTSDVTKTYDGTLTAVGAATVNSGTLYTNTSNSNALDSLSGGTFAFTNANAGAGDKTVSTSAVTVSDGNSGNNYNVTYANNTTSTINKANLILSTSDVTKTYDGTLTASGAAIVSSGTLYTNASNSNTLDSISGGTFAFADANADAGSKTVSTSAVTVNDGNSGGNYNVTYANNTTSTINKANVTLSTSGVTKSYDGTLTASGTAIVSSGTLYTNASNSNTLDSISGGTFGFTNANAGAGNKTVSTSAVTVNDGNGGGNYSVNYANNTTSTISAANLIFSTGNVSKIYDGNLTASGSATVVGGTLFGSDSISGGSFAFVDKNVGIGNKAVTTAGVTINDGNGGTNYSIGYVDNTTSTITAANLAVTGVTANNKIYDGTTAATLSGAATVAPIGADVVTVSGAGSGAFFDANVGVGKAVTVSGFALSGTDAGNYAIIQPVGLSADILAIPVVPDVVPDVVPEPAPSVILDVATTAEIQDVTGQIQSSIFFPATNIQSPPSLSSESVEQEADSDSATPSATQNVSMSSGGAKSLLQIVDGGVKLPDSNIEENDDR